MAAPYVPPGAQDAGLIVIAGVAYRPRIIDWPAGSANVALVGRRGVLIWYALRETTGAAAAVVRLRSGADATSTMIAPVHLASGDSISQWIGGCGIPCDAGVYLEAVSGSTEGSILYGEA